MNPCPGPLEVAMSMVRENVPARGQGKTAKILFMAEDHLRFVVFWAVRVFSDRGTTRHR